jgi:hypothetical protein
MNDQEFIISIVAVVCGTGFTIFFFSEIFKLIRMALERKTPGNTDARDMQLREEFVKFRRQAEQRISMLESGLVQESSTQKEAPRVALPEAEDAPSGDRLPNMLRQKA